MLNNPSSIIFAQCKLNNSYKTQKLDLINESSLLHEDIKAKETVLRNIKEFKKQIFPILNNVVAEKHNKFNHKRALGFPKKTKTISDLLKMDEQKVTQISEKQDSKNIDCSLHLNESFNCVEKENIKGNILQRESEKENQHLIELNECKDNSITEEYEKEKFESLSVNDIEESYQRKGSNIRSINSKSNNENYEDEENEKEREIEIEIENMEINNQNQDENIDEHEDQYDESLMNKKDEDFESKKRELSNLELL